MTTYLPLLSDPSGPRHGSRSRMTCHYRCGDACDKPLPNTSDNPEFADIAERALARRTVLGGAAAGAGALVVGGLASPAAAAPPSAAPVAARAGAPMGRVRFAPVPPNDADRVTVPDGFRSDVVISWGDPILAGAPAFDVDAQTPAKARRQFGYNNDFLAVLPLRRRTALMFSNHEYTNEELMFPTGAYDEETQKRIAMASHGLSVVKLRRGARPGSWNVAGLDNPYNRRFHTATPFAVDGPAAGTPRMRTSADPEGRTVLGTLNNCSGGVTPWGTVLSGEENIDQYFEASSGTLPARYAESYERYGFQAEPERGWGSVDDRFDLTKEPHEAFRFGWVVEVDPYDKKSTPRKHTMLGRFKHEGANVVISRTGHAVAYMGDDEKGEYLYKFVSAETMRTGGSARARRRNMQLLTKGTLYVGALTDGRADPAPEYDGDGHWIPLCSDTESYVDGMSVADVLIDTRLAADTKRATRMDRPEDVDVNPVNGRVYACLTNNDKRGSDFPVDEPNPIGTSQTRASLGRSSDEQLRQPQRLRAGDAGPPRRPRHARLHLAPHARVRRPRGAGDLLRRVPQGQGEPDQLPRQRRLRRRGQPVDLHRRQQARLQRRPVPGADRRAAARPGAPVPHGSRGGGDLRSGHHPRPAHGVRGRAAPG